MAIPEVVYCDFVVTTQREDDCIRVYLKPGKDKKVDNFGCLSAKINLVGNYPVLGEINLTFLPPMNLLTKKDGLCWISGFTTNSFDDLKKAFDQFLFEVEEAVKIAINDENNHRYYYKE